MLLCGLQRVAAVELSLLGRAAQTGEQVCTVMSVGDAVRGGLINNETLGYYMARTQLFLVHIGVDRSRIRFRQHLSTEMAHYAADCWDAELHGSYGWVEAVGHADRAAYDLRVHSDKSKKELVAQETLDAPRMEEVAVIKPQYPLLGKQFGKHPAFKLLVRATHTHSTEHTAHAHAQQNAPVALADDDDDGVAVRAAVCVSDGASQGPGEGEGGRVGSACAAAEGVRRRMRAAALHR